MGRKNHPRKSSSKHNTRKDRLITNIVTVSMDFVDFSTVSQQNREYIFKAATDFAYQKIRHQHLKAGKVSINNYYKYIPEIIHSIQPMAIKYGAIINYIPKPPIKTKPKPQTNPDEKTTK